MGSLTFAFLERVKKGDFGRGPVDSTVFEVDEGLYTDLRKNLEQSINSISKAGNQFTYTAVLEDFIVHAAEHNGLFQEGGYSHVILNPPYRKIHSGSDHRNLLRILGIETVNLYSAFIELAIQQMADHGELVAIIQRSFCNGPYYRSFRRYLHAATSVIQIHLFESRSKAFADDEVLQENVIIYLAKKPGKHDVIVSTSMDSSFADYKERKVNVGCIFAQGDEEHILRIPSVVDNTANRENVHCKLSDLNLSVSTGPIVSFRVKLQLKKDASKGDVPLIYPGHFSGMRVIWPRENFKKYNALTVNEELGSQLYPKGYYVLVRRFSSKEEKRRINAAVISPADIPGKHCAFENHVNVFHCAKTGIEEDLAWGLAVYLNSTSVDLSFREFNGHTQVNATDLRLLKYPGDETLKRIGGKFKKAKTWEQAEIDKAIKGAL